ncbi:hypothetical protein, partial [Prosthecobacter sp.]|uniref:hypothetical protein n=1 Tax=Prosthecobacter sp. TaxID=1965333 RepID=UPI0037C6C61B
LNLNRRAGDCTAVFCIAGMGGRAGLFPEPAEAGTTLRALDFIPSELKKSLCEPKQRGGKTELPPSDWDMVAVGPTTAPAFPHSKDGAPF